MEALAKLAIRRRWLVIVAWIVVIFVAQGVASALGGAAYKDTFSLPHTETATVTKLLKNAGLNNQTGAVGTVVLKDKNGKFSGAPSGLQPALVGVCSSGNHVALITTPWQSIDCSKGAAVTSGNPKLLNTHRGSTTALVNITWENSHYEASWFKHVYDRLKQLRSPVLQAEFTGNAFGGVGQSQGSGSSVFIGFLAALIILAIVFRTVAATVLPLACAAVALVGGLGMVYILSHGINVSNITPYLTELMVIGVGVDYALFIVTRHRRNLRRGMSIPDSIVIAINTSGTSRAVRRDDGVHRHPRAHRTRRELLQRDGRSYGSCGCLHHGRVPDLAAGLAEPVRLEGAPA